MGRNYEVAQDYSRLVATRQPVPCTLPIVAALTAQLNKYVAHISNVRDTPALLIH